MTINIEEVHQKKISANLDEAELKQAILEYVLRQHDVGDAEYRQRIWLNTNHRSTGIDYGGRCEIIIDLTSADT